MKTENLTSENENLTSALKSAKEDVERLQRVYEVEATDVIAAKVELSELTERKAVRSNDAERQINYTANARNDRGSCVCC